MTFRRFLLDPLRFIRLGDDVLYNKVRMSAAHDIKLPKRRTDVCRNAIVPKMKRKALKNVKDPQAANGRIPSRWTHCVDLQFLHDNC